MADYARRLNALELRTRPQSEETFLEAERRLSEAAKSACREGTPKWTCELFRIRQGGNTMLEAVKRAKLPDAHDYPGKAEDEALLKRYREATGWEPPLAEYTEEGAAEILEKIYGNVSQRIGAKHDCEKDGTAGTQAAWAALPT